MGLCNISLALVCILGIALLLQPTHAQDSLQPTNAPYSPPPTPTYAPDSPPPTHAQNSSQDYLNAHNAARGEVGVGQLTWDESIASYAQNYANQHIGDCNLVHSGGPYGENLAMSTGDMSSTDAVDLWVREKADYDYNSNSCAEGKICRHYTQVVWRKSARVGCGKALCSSGGTFIGCNYDPPGNYVGQKPY